MRGSEMTEQTEGGEIEEMLWSLFEARSRLFYEECAHTFAVLEDLINSDDFTDDDFVAA